MTTETPKSSIILSNLSAHSRSSMANLINSLVDAVFYAKIIMFQNTNQKLVVFKTEVEAK